MYYPGNKNIPGLIQKIINQIPPCTYFYELYAGSAAVSLVLSLVTGINLHFHINDIDPAVTANIDYPAGSTVTTLPAAGILQQLLTVPDPENHFIFLDPPYHHSTRPNSLNLYNFEMSHTDHVQFLSMVLTVKCNCMIIHPRCELYDQELKSFRKVQLSVQYHNKTSIENLYMNYPGPGQLLTYNWAGTDCWDRQRIKRKGDRIVNKLSNLPVLERNYIIDRINNSQYPTV